MPSVRSHNKAIKQICCFPLALLMSAINADDDECGDDDDVDDGDDYGDDYGEVKEEEIKK